MLLIYGVVYPIAGLALLSVLLLLAGVRLPAGWCWLLLAAGVAASVARLVYLAGLGEYQWGFDHRIFWEIGRDVLRGVDPYQPGRFREHPFLNPPSTLPVFAAMATLPLRASIAAWSVLYSALAFVIVWLARATVATGGSAGARALTGAELAVLATAFALSDACMATLELGQVALLATALILLGLRAEQHRRPAAAGVALGLATMKVGTMVPFLLLFLRRRDLRAWVGLGVSVAALVVLGGFAAQLSEHARLEIRYIGEFAEPGAVNDISYEGPQHTWILGIDHLAYRLGVRSPGALKAIQGAVLLLIGGGLAWEILAGRIARGLAIALVSVYSVIFLYHRLYDAVMVAPALVYAVGESRVRRGPRRWLLAAAALALLAVLYLRRRPLAVMTDWALAHPGPAGTIIEALVLPAATWGILLSLALLRLAGDGRPSPLPGPADAT